MATTYSSGVVTAYGAALEGGFTGTYEDFCQLMATLPTEYGNIEGSIAQPYSSSNTYTNIGTYVWHNGILYKNIVPITTAEEWTAAHWTTAEIGGDLINLENIVSATTGNLLPDYNANSWTSPSSVSITRDGYALIINGTKENAGAVTITDQFVLGAGSYEFGVCDEDSLAGTGAYIQLFADGDVISQTQTHTPVTVPSATNATFRILLGAGSSFTNLSVKPMLFSGSLPSTYIPQVSAHDYVARNNVGEALSSISNLSNALDDVRVETEVTNLISVSQENQSIASSATPTIVYGEGGITVTIDSTGLNTWGYKFDTVIGKTYAVSFSIVLNGSESFSVSAVKNNSYSSTTYLNKISDVTTGDYSFEFTATTEITTLWFSSNRNNTSCVISGTKVVDKSELGWKYGNLQTTLLSDDFPPSSKAVGDAITPHIVGETNIFVGQSAGKNTVESQDDTSPETYDKGRYNAALGYNAMIANTDGHHDTAVGFCALRNNTTGAFNTAIGEDALYASTTQTGNTGIGSHVMQNNTGEYNVAVGAENSRYPTGMEYSVAIGYHANYSNYNGTNNVFIGAAAGPSSDVDNCIAIGAQATVNDDNQIVIGNANNDTVIIAGKVISFNLDGSVTWTAVS